MAYICTTVSKNQKYFRYKSEYSNPIISKRMKKFYSFAVSMAVALTVSAVAADFDGIRQTAPVKMVPSNSDIQMTKVSSFDKLNAELPDGQLPKVKAEAVDEGIEGDYTVTIGDYYFQTSKGQYESECSVSLTTGALNRKYAVFSCPDFVSQVSAPYNATTGTVTFGASKLGAANVGGTQYYIQFTPFAYEVDPETEKGKVVSGSFSATYANGKITFPAEHGFAWIAFSDENYTSAAGYLELFDVEGMEKIVVDDSAWSKVGMATFADPWVLSCFGINATTETEYQYEVELQQSIDDAFEYRLVDPYHGNFPGAELNESTSAGYIQFNVSDPDHVTFSAVPSGFAMAKLDVSKFYCLNQLSALMGTYNLPAAQVIEAMGNRIPYTTYKEGVVSFVSVESTDNDNNPITIYDACFGDQSNRYGGYGWQTKDNVAVPMVGFIKFPGNEGSGIDGIVVDENAPVKYYNLQGVEVASPAAGQMVIRVKGNKATKMIAE